MKDFTKANNEIKKVCDYIKEHEKMFDMMDLKLHDVSFYQWENELDNELFYDFCDCSYNWMLEYFTENNITFNPSYIGRTSKFYLDKRITFSCRFPYEPDYQSIIYDLLDDMGYCDCIPDITTDCKIDINDPYINDCEANIDYIENDLYNDFIKSCEDVKKVYEYIKDFKDNQVEYFKDFIECNYTFDELKKGATAAETVLNNLDVYGIAI